MINKDFLMGYGAGKKSGGGGGGDLPPVTSDDNGDVLTVVEGAWDKAAPSGGGDFLVTITENDGTYTADKTNAEIYAAAQAGKFVRAMIALGEHIYMYYPSEVTEAYAVFGSSQYYTETVDSPTGYGYGLEIITNEGVQSVSVHWAFWAVEDDS